MYVDSWPARPYVVLPENYSHKDGSMQLFKMSLYWSITV